MRLLLISAALFLCSVQSYPYRSDYSEEVRPWIRTKIKELMKRDLLSNLPTHTYTLDTQLQKDILRELIDEELTAKNVKLVTSFVSRQQESLLHAGYVKIYEEICKKHLGDYALFHLASQVKEDLYRGDVASLLTMFPLAVRSVFTSKTVCIKNRGYGEYLYAAAEDLKYDATHRNVFTWRPHNEAGKAGDWAFHHIEGNHFHIVNDMFGERFVAGRDSFNMNAERRRVFTIGSDASEGDIWALEMDGEDVFIRNVHFNEYFYALDGEEFDKSRRAVLTWVPKGRENCDSATYQCRWFVSHC